MGEFTVEPHPDYENEFLFKDKKGKEIVPTFRPMFDDHDVSADTLDVEQYGENVSADTCVTKWMGERMDLPYAVGTIMDLEEYAASHSADRFS